MAIGAEGLARPLWRESLTRTMGLLLGGIALLALAGMGSSLLIAHAGRGDAAAINLAGSLRMQSYRIATQVLEAREGVAGRAAQVAGLSAEFERRLDSAVLDQAVPQAASDERRLLLDRIRRYWSDTIRPLLLGAGGSDARTRGEVFLDGVDGYVADIDRLVSALERGAEAKLAWLRGLQGGALAVCALLAVLAWREVYRRVLPPLRELLALAGRARQGDFGFRAAHVGADELGVLGQAFNAMAEDLAKLYADLETRVQEQTQALRQSNRSLQLLYNTTRRLGEAPPDATNLQALLIELASSVGASAAALCLEPRGGAQVAAAIVAGRPPDCGVPECRGCLSSDPVRVFAPGPDTHVIPIEDQGQRFGALLVQDLHVLAVDDDRRQVLETVARHIATSLRASQREVSQRRLALLEERNVIARELHDSLAQSLSYLKIQVSRLQTLLPEDRPAAASDILVELREGLNNAYRELRELLTTFRIAMPATGLQPALARALEEFGSRGHLAATLDFGLEGPQLSPHQEIHVLQIVREALSNVVHHARARSVHVALERCGDQVQVRIEDDGVGLPENPERDRHYGLNIMRERTRSLGGQIAFLSRDRGGCRVELGFPANTGNLLPIQEHLPHDHA